MTARATDEPHRVASQLELLFDLTFVIAIASLTARFAHALADGHALDELVPFLQVFFAIWWAWVNFTWFGSSFDTDDVAFRLLTMVQMAGVLVLAAGVPAAFDDGDLSAVTLGYAIMRLGLVAQWLRAALEDPASRATALRYATGITIATAAWVLRLRLHEAGVLSDAALLLLFVALVIFEMGVPAWAERKGPTSWHPHHIAERYGLFAIIVLGESVFVASTGVDRALAAGGVSVPLVAVAVSALALVFALWWLYFLQPAGAGLASHRERSYLWGYGHYGIFAALAAVGAGLEVAVEHAGGHHIAASPVAVGYAVAIPVTAFLFLLWALHTPIIPRPVLRPAPMLGGSLAILLLPLAASQVSLAVIVAAIAITCAALVAVTISRARIATGDNSGA
ncbi:MAG TPA: low temperature requirement protein A [Solirubrobacteraceae bacterium]|nr:low temperature requirement protein A [Solirubrobacteraceae bacterium]